MSYIQKIKQSEVLNLTTLVPIEAQQINSKTLVRRTDLTLTLFALGESQEIGQHSSNGDAMVQLLAGVAKITIADQSYVLHAGETIIMPANVPHSLYAVEGFQMLLTVVKPLEGEE